MNVLEHYIIEIHSEQQIDMPFETDCTWVEVDITTNCYGIIKRDKIIFIEDVWENAKNIGYYLA